MDKCIKALALNESVRIYIINNTDTVNEAIKRHNLWPSATSVLGKTMAIAQMMGLMLKGEEALTIKINGNGSLGKVIVDCNSKGEVRGYVDHPDVNFVNNKGGLNDTYAVGSEGIIEVIKDLKMKDLFTSSVRLTGNLASDFTYYFYESEQTLSLLSLGILVNDDNTCDVSGGIIIQLLPNATEDEIKYIESKQDKLNNFSNALKEKSLEDILKDIFSDYEVLTKTDVCFKCTCSKESFSRSLLTLGSKTLDEIKCEDHKIEAVCHYCNNVYNFSEEEIQSLINEAKRQGK